MNIYDVAVDIAKAAHAGQTYGGKDYYEEHVRAVYYKALDIYKVLGGPATLSEAEIAALAIMHDVVEDSDVTFDDLEKMGVFSAEFIEALKCLTKGYYASDYDAYMYRLMTNPNACVVKLADSLCNFKAGGRPKYARNVTKLLDVLADG